MKNNRRGLRRAVGLVMALVLAVSVTGYTFHEMRYSYAVNGVTQHREVQPISAFPASYQSGLTEVQKAFPNATFVYFDTGLSWSQLFASDSFLYPYRCTVPNSKNSSGGYNYPSSYKGIELNDAFNFIQNDWNVKEGGWTQASDGLIRYYVDPRNWLTSNGIFSFLSASYNPQLDTVGYVNAALKGTFMYNAEIDAPEKYEAYSVENTGKVTVADPDVTMVKMTYAEVFCLLAEHLNVSALSLANRVRLEQGVKGDSALISGTYKGFEGYYNYFNIGATGADSSEVYKNGLQEAKDRGWDSRYKALLGGAARYTLYARRGQNSPYLLKYNVVADSNGTVSYSPYMTAVFSAESEAKNFYNTFTNLGLIHQADGNGKVSDAAFQFVIPVYRDMPDGVCAKPVGDGNPNYKLKGLAVNNYQYPIGTFDVDTLSYSTVVPYASSSVAIAAAVFASTSTVEINGVSMGKGHTDVARSVDLKVGNNTVTVKVNAENGLSRIYTINIYRQEKVGDTDEYSYSFSGVSEDIQNSRISGISLGTTVGSFLANNVKTQNATARVLNSAGAVADSSSRMGTGQKLQILYNGQLKREYTILLYGDITGDGVINVMDILKQKRHILGIASMTSLETAVGDLNSDGTINVMDILAIKRDILDIAKIPQKGR